jgi:hypothetical protein
MKLNMGTTDRIVRAVVALVAVILAVTIGGGWGIVFWIVAAIMALTSVVGFCPLYAPFRVSTRVKK